MGYVTVSQRELLCAVVTGKPIIAVVESDQRHGGLTRAEIEAQLHDAEARSAQYGLGEDIAVWRPGAAAPSSQDIYNALFASDPIEWQRLAPYQNVALRLIGERLLPAKHPGVYLQDELAFMSPNLPTVPPGQYHLFCSRNNSGALELIREAAARYPSFGAVRVCTSAAEIPQCAAMLVYLNGNTWTRGERSTSFAAEVHAALDADVTLLLCHETIQLFQLDGSPGSEGASGQGPRAAVSFESFMKRGATPEALVERGLYTVRIWKGGRGGMGEELTLPSSSCRAARS